MSQILKRIVIAQKANVYIRDLRVFLRNIGDQIDLLALDSNGKIIRTLEDICNSVSLDELLSELERLSIAFGIGIIKLDLEDIDSSYILYHSTPKKELDWETINKLAEINIDFKKFIQDVKIENLSF